MNIFKKTKKETNKLPMTGKVRKGLVGAVKMSDRIIREMMGL